MIPGRKTVHLVLPTIISLLIVPGVLSAENETAVLEFAELPVSGSDTSRTLQSLVRVRGTGRFCQDGLYLMTHVGDRDEIFEEENRALIDNPFINQTWRFCSVFSAHTDTSVIVGRNWDNQNVGSIIVSLYHPPNGYSSISFCRSIDLGFGHKDLTEIASSPFGNKLLLAPFYSMDGINEHGLTAAIAADEDTAVKPRPGKRSVFITFLVRKILDQAQTVEDAAELVEKFTPFLLDENSLSAHLLVCDPSGGSVILEYDGDQWRKTYSDKPWQVMSTKRVFNVPDANLREKCWRYKSMSETLEKSKGGADRAVGMKILRDVTQKGTTWSIVYRPRSKDLYFSVYQNWGDVYHLTLP